jgi:hypothetical protein
MQACALSAPAEARWQVIYQRISAGTNFDEVGYVAQD